MPKRTRNKTDATLLLFRNGWNKTEISQVLSLPYKEVCKTLTGVEIFHGGRRVI